MDDIKSPIIKTNTVLRQLIQIPPQVSGIMIILSALFIMYDVLTRYFGQGTYWADEIAGYFLVAISFLGSGFTLQSGKHVQVKFVLEKLSPTINKVLDMVIKILILLITLIIFYLGSRYVLDLYLLKVKFITMLSVPQFIPYAAIPIGAFFLLLEVIRELILDLFSDKGGNSN